MIITSYLSLRGKLHCVQYSSHGHLILTLQRKILVAVEAQFTLSAADIIFNLLLPVKKKNSLQLFSETNCSESQRFVAHSAISLLTITQRKNKTKKSLQLFFETNCNELQRIWFRCWIIYIKRILFPHRCKRIGHEFCIWLNEFQTNEIIIDKRISNEFQTNFW